MPQARLPDINTQYVMLTREAITNFKSRNYSLCIGSLYSLNALMPGEYRVIISDQLYAEKTKTKMFVECLACKEQTELKNVTKFKLIIPTVEKYFSGNEYEEMWSCIKCKKNNRMALTEPIQEVLQEPYFIHVVPQPPAHKDGLLSRNSYHKYFSVWFWSIFTEIEESMARFRDDNWQKPGEFYEGEENVKDTGEEKD